MPRPRKDNVIYANFGARRGVRVDNEPATAALRRDKPLGDAAAWLVAGVEKRADAGRITRGRAYARAGHVVSLEIEAPGRIAAQVAGSQNEPFAVTVALEYRSTDDLMEVTRRLTHPAQGNDSLAKARAGQLSAELLEVLMGTDITFSCDCPDRVPACKHAVAVCEVVAGRMDADPEFVFAARGLNFAQMERYFTQHAQQESRESAAATDGRFWTGLELPALPEPRLSPAIADSDLDALHKAMRTVSYTSVEQLRAVSDIEDLYDHLTRSMHQ